MLSSSSLFTTGLLALAASASPVVIRDAPSTLSLPFATLLNLSGSTLPALDRARATHLLSRGKTLERLLDGAISDSELPLALAARAGNVGVTNTAVTYVATVGVGSPPTNYTLLVDTGSANTWVGARKKYASSSTSKNTGKKVAVSYGSGSFSGNEYTDTVTLSPALVISQQSIGVASSSSGISDVDGILGLGPAALTAGTVANVSTVPTVSDSLFAQKKITTEVVGISYNPISTTTGAAAANGELTFGGPDASKYTGALTYAPLTTASPARYYWGIDQKITYGSNKSAVLAQTAGIVDTGTTLVLIASDAFTRYKALTGATEDAATGLLTLSSAQYARMESLYFAVGGTTFELTRNAQTWPRTLNSAIGGAQGSIYLVVSDLGSASGQGLDFINGYAFLERFYSVYDTSKNRVGLATTANTKSTSN
ncbi:acid protease [Phellopilus nigrolimitatus]|nr:acid protease [Phellopilus nigrolimitatus]